MSNQHDECKAAWRGCLNREHHGVQCRDTCERTEEDIYDCPIHGKIGVPGDPCPRC